MNVKQRVIAGIIQDPLLCFESPMERALYNEFKTFGLVPTLQYPVGRYFLDFAFPQAFIGVEYDGKIHQGREVYDQEKDDFLGSQGWRIYRLTSFHFQRIRFDEDSDEMVPERLIHFMGNLKLVLSQSGKRLGGFQKISEVFTEQIEAGKVGSIKLDGAAPSMLPTQRKAK